MDKKYQVKLTDDQRRLLRRWLVEEPTRHTARRRLRAHILLQCDDGDTDIAVASRLRVSTRMVEAIRKEFALHGLDGVLEERPRGRQRSLSIDIDEVGVALARSQTAQRQWLLRLTTNGHVELLSDDHNLPDPATFNRPTQHTQWKLPHVNPTFVWQMEDILAIYTQPVDDRLVVCLDEKVFRPVQEQTTQLMSDRGELDDNQPSKACYLILLLIPARRWRQVLVVERRAAASLAQYVKDLIEQHHRPLRMVSESSSSHTPALFYEAFASAEALRLADQVDWHHTPQQGGWLNMAGLELTLLIDHLQDHSAATLKDVERLVDTWVLARNKAGQGIEWAFTIPEARRYLVDLYPATGRIEQGGELLATTEGGGDLTKRDA